MDNPDPDTPTKLVAAAMRAMRERLELTQQQLSNELGKAISSVARWEGSRLPEDRELAALFRFAAARGCRAEAKTFQQVLEQRLGLLVRLP